MVMINQLPFMRFHDWNKKNIDNPTATASSTLDYPLVHKANTHAAVAHNERARRHTKSSPSRSAEPRAKRAQEDPAEDHIPARMIRVMLSAITLCGSGLEQSTPLSLPTQVEVELGWDNYWLSI